MTDNLTRAFKELLNQERFGSQSEIVDALKKTRLYRYKSIKNLQNAHQIWRGSHP